MNDKMYFLTHVGNSRVEPFTNLDSLRVSLDSRSWDDEQTCNYQAWVGKKVFSHPEPGGFFKPDKPGVFILEYRGDWAAKWEYEGPLENKEASNNALDMETDDGTDWDYQIYEVTEVPFRVVPAHVEFLPIEEAS